MTFICLTESLRLSFYLFFSVYEFVKGIGELGGGFN